MPANRTLFVTGTDTEVGKTLVSCALLVALRAQGFTTAALKPLAAGAQRTGDALVNDDALALQAAASVQLPLADVSPCVLAEPIAPHIAAHNVGQTLAVDNLLGLSQPVLQTPVDYLVIEGAGGWLVPLNRRETLADYATALAADIVLVVGMRLGCINHALLSVAAIEASGLRLVGWVANHIEPNMPEAEANLETLCERIDAPLLGVIPHLRPADSARCAASLELSTLLSC